MLKSATGCISSLILFFAAALGTAHAEAAPTATPVPSTRQSLNDAWWTGPLLAPGAGTLPRGHLLVEPYLFDVIQYGAYDRHGTLGPSTHAHTLGNLTYIIYGLADRFNVGVIPTITSTSITNGPSNSGPKFGDFALLAQYRLASYRPGSWIPTTSLSVQETLPTAPYDNLGTHPIDGTGGGVYSTKVSLYTQTYFWMPNGRILRSRLNFSQTFSNSATVNGVSVYGTGPGFSGHAQPGNIFSVDAAAEYSATRNWVLAGDLVYTYSANTRVTGTSGIMDSGDSHSFALAPAVEYNWNANVGIIAGFRLYPSGVNTSASITPVIAVNYVH